MDSALAVGAGQVIANEGIFLTLVVNTDSLDVL